jgi:ribosomal protein S12 methylthiotransferase
MADRQALFSLVNLGCPKNTVDSEGILGSLALAGFGFVEDPEAADLCLVNTCGFLDASRREAAEVLAELAELRKERGTPLLVATGCLVERVGGAKELAGFLADADACVGFADYSRLPEICAELLEGHAPPFAKASGDQAAKRTRGYAGRELPRSYVTWLDQPRMRIGGVESAYLKIGEGCSNNCAYCSIPLIRGQRASRSVKSILREARQLVDSGAKELNLIAQDTTAYGTDRDGKPQLAALLQQLLQMPEDLWFRILYAHPRHLRSDILRVMASDPRVCPYLDLPLQHVNGKMLKAMRRGYGAARVEQSLELLDRFLPGAALRTTFIVGHPGEGDKEFEELLTFVEAGHFDHMGVFVWSPEPGTASVEQKGRVEPAVAQERCDRLMRAQAVVSAARLRARKGASTTMLLEGQTEKGWHGRTVWQAPEVDGETVLEGSGAGLTPGDLVPVKITRTTRYDCRARLLK